MIGLDLFSGIGGISYALKNYVTPCAYCEIDPYCAAVLASRMHTGELSTAPIFPDVTRLRAEILPRGIEIIYGGFPCQDLSLAGRRAGLEGKRSGLFFEVVRLAAELSPRFVFLENVLGIRKHVPAIRAEFEKLGFSCRDGFLSAKDVGAAHLRERWFFLAYAMRLGLSRSVSIPSSQQKMGGTTTKCSEWVAEPNVVRVVHGVPHRVDAIRGLGNSVVPQCAKKAFEILMGLYDS